MGNSMPPPAAARASKTDAPAGMSVSFPKANSRPDPTLLTDEQRMSEFGHLISRAIERRAAKERSL